MRFVTLFTQGPLWQAGKSVYQQGPVIEDHLRSMRRLFNEGVLLVGGPFDEDGGIALIEAPDRDAAVALIEADPAVRAGVLGYRLHRLHAYFDATASFGTDLSVSELAEDRSRRAEGPRP